MGNSKTKPTVRGSKMTMHAELMSRIGTWSDVRDAARNTVWKKALGDSKEVSESFKRKILMSEHSPIRCLQFRIALHVPYWVSVHLIRHESAAPVLGVEHFVTTQRSDRTGIPRDELPQGAPVVHEILANAQGLIQVSRARLCYVASPETTQAWLLVKKLMREIGEKELADCMVAQCIYRGHCPEDICKPRYIETPKFSRDLLAYRATIV